MRLSYLVILLCLVSFPVFAQSPPAPGGDARCAVCGMFVAPHTNWVAVLETADGVDYYFDGPKDLFIFFTGLDSDQPGISPDTVKLFVTEYYTVTLKPATEVYFVTGSDVLGPMGEELVPIAGLEAADTFLRDHGGTKIMQFDGRQLVDFRESR